VYVDASRPAGGSGADWSDAFASLRDAFAAATGTAEIWVAAGTYRPDRGVGVTIGDVTATFAPPANHPLFGGFAGVEQNRARRALASASVLDGDLLGNDAPAFANRADNTRTVVTMPATAGGYLVDGFTIKGGHGGGPAGVAGLAANRQAIFRRLLIRDNDVDDAFDLGSNGSRLEDSIVEDNTGDRPNVVGATLLRVIYRRNGNAIRLRASGADAVVVGCLFESNTPLGAIEASLSGGRSVYVLNSVFKNNARNTVAGGSAIYANEDGGASGVFVVESSTFVGHGTGAVILADGVSGNTSTTVNVRNVVATNNGGPNFSSSGPGTIPTTFVCTSNCQVDANGVPTATSPVIDTGATASLMTDRGDMDGDGNVTEPLPFDFVGVTRVQGGTIDKGAYEVR
jgi:hypothetical protein